MVTKGSNSVFINKNDYEAENFNNFFSRYSLFQSRLALALGVVMYMVFVFLDVWMIPDVSAQVLWIRAAVTSLMVIVLGLSYTKYFTPILQQVLYTIVALAASIGIIIMIALTNSPGGKYYFSGIMLVVVWQFIFLGLRTQNATGAFIVIMIVYNIVAIQIRPEPATVVINNNFFIIGAGIICFFQCLTIERQRIAIFQSTLMIKQAEKKAQTANEAKTVFLANMSHEIRTPLNAIVGFSQILLERASKDDLKISYLQQLGNVKESGQRLSELINNILDLSKIEAGKMEVEIQPINLKQLFKSIYHIMRVKANEKDVVFNYDYKENLPEVVEADRTKINQILINLTSNAIKFTPAKKEVKMIAEREGDFILFKTIDKGIGIAPKIKNKIFESFEQADSSITRRFGGTGLGLSITKKLVGLLGGSIDLESEIGKGTSFYVRLPLKESSVVIKESEKYEFSKNSLSKDNKILIAEDNKMNRAMLSDFFVELELPIHMAVDGEMAIKMAKEIKPDIILMDLHMPKIDGFKAATILREIDDFHEVPIIALTADVFREKKERALSIGFNDYITKPIDLKNLVSVLEKYLKKDAGFSEKANEGKSEFPKELEGKLKEELKKFKNIPVYSMGQLVDQIEVVREITASYDLPLNAVLTSFENAIFSGNMQEVEDTIKLLTNEEIYTDS